LEEVEMKKLLVLMLVLAVASIASAELFLNGDFEAGAWSGGGSGSGGGGTPWGWQPYPPQYQTSGGSDGGAWMQLDQSAAPYTGTWNWAWSGVWTDSFATSGGTDLTISGMAQHLAGDATLRAFLSYHDADGLRVDINGDGISEVLGNGTGQNPYHPDRILLTWDTTAGWDAFSTDIVVPLGFGITQMNVTFSVEDAPGAVGVDELSLVPEPITIGLLGLGGLFIRRRK
jgi:hypothetical protein